MDQDLSGVIEVDMIKSVLDKHFPFAEIIYVNRYVEAHGKREIL